MHEVAAFVTISFRKIDYGRPARRREGIQNPEYG